MRIGTNEKLSQSDRQRESKDPSLNKEPMDIIQQKILNEKPNRFDIILCDCPWEFITRGKSSAKTHYGRMTLKGLAQLPVSGVAAGNSAMFFWVVDWLRPSVQEEIANAWGFTYRTKAWSWVKTNKSGFGTFMGRGFYTRNCVEDCWLFVRGSMPVDNHSILSAIFAPISIHSRKPDDQYRKIEALYPNRRYLELFARSKSRPNWHYWGNEVKSDIELYPTDYPNQESLEAAA